MTSWPGSAVTAANPASQQAGRSTALSGRGRVDLDDLTGLAIGHPDSTGNGGPSDDGSRGWS